MDHLLYILSEVYPFKGIFFFFFFLVNKGGYFLLFFFCNGVHRYIGHFRLKVIFKWNLSIVCFIEFRLLLSGSMPYIFEVLKLCYGNL